MSRHGRPRGLTLEELRQLRPAGAGRTRPSLQSLIDARNGITAPHTREEKKRSNAEAMRRVAASLPHPRQPLDQGARESTEPQRLTPAEAPTTTNPGGGPRGCGYDGTG